MDFPSPARFILALTLLPSPALASGKASARVPGASEPLALRPGADLRWENLRSAPLAWLNLDGCNFSYADLRGADLTGASLKGARFTSANLEGARLFGANLKGAVDLDTSRVEAHPFFRRQESLGALNFFQAPSPPMSLVVGPDGSVFWLPEPGDAVNALSSNGMVYHSPAAMNSRLHALVMDTQARLWTFGDRSFGYLDPLDFTREGKEQILTSYAQSGYLAAPPGQIAPGAGGMLFLAGGDGVVVCRAKGNALEVAKLAQSSLPAIPPTTSIAACMGGAVLVHFHPDHSRLWLRTRDSARTQELDLPAGSHPRGLAAEGGTRVWLTLRDPAALASLDLATGEYRLCKLEDLGDGPRDPDRIVLGPDGAMWFTEPALGRLGRVLPGGSVQSFALPPGHKPVELAASPDGRMIFTLEGKPLLGSIRAVEPAPAEGKAPAAWEAWPFESRPEKRKVLTDQQRRDRHEKILERAEARFKARMAAEPAEAPPPPGWFRVAAPAPSEEKAAAQAPPGIAPALRLEGLKVSLTRGALGHILANHGHGRKPHKSQFAAAHATPEALEELLTRGIEEAGAIGRVLSDTYGRYHTLCRIPASGYANDHGQFTGTSRFVVVTAKFLDEGEWWDDVVTAYPVAEGW